MNTTGEAFELPVDYKGAESVVPCRFVEMGYTYKIYAQTPSCEIVFEPDEERNFRAWIDPADSKVKIDPGFVQAIGQALEKYLR